jgi:crossover junction endodeoxyribonuclease RuvC
VTVRVLGVDPGTAATGFGVVEPVAGRPGRLVECGVIRTNSRDKLWRRLDIIHEGVTELIGRHRPTVLALESVFYAKNVRTTVTLGHVRGVILLAAAQAGLEVAEFTPRAIKKSVTGAGGAAKPQVGHMVQRLLNLKDPPRPSDAADGVAVGLTYLLTRSRTR